MNNKIPLTDVFLRKTKAPESGQRDIWDAKIPGFGIRLSASGVKAFVMVYRYRGAWRRDTLGRYPETSLQKARAKAERARADLSAGIDPRSNRPTSRPATAKDSFETAARDFIAGHLQLHNRASTAYESERILNSVFLPEWSRRQLTSITRADVLAILDPITARGAPSAARHAFATIRKFFNWCAERQLVATSPCAAMKPPAKAASRDRVLTAFELATLWHHAEHQHDTFGRIVQLLMLTAQRRSEVSAMQWQEIDRQAAVWTIPGSRTKNGKPHSIPLTALALAILADVETAIAAAEEASKTSGQPHNRSAYVFPARGKPEQSFTGWSKAKRALDAAAKLHDWSLHDLRRTAATMMALQGTPPHVVERVLNHVSGTFAGVAGIYNRHQYAAEMRLALDAWSERLRVIVTDATSNQNRTANPEICP